MTFSGTPTPAHFPHNAPTSRAQPSGLTRAALLWTPPRERATVLGWLAWAADVARVGLQVQDPGVAQAKLQWWHQELSRAYTQQAQHPALKALITGRESHRADLAWGEAYIQSCLLDAQQSRHLDERSLLSHANMSGGSLATWCAGWVTPMDQPTTAWTQAMGTALRLARIVRHTGADAARGRLYIPIADLQRFDIKAHQILSRSPDVEDSPNFQALMRHQVERVKTALQQAQDLQPSRLPLACSALPIRAELERHLLDVIAGQGFAVMRQHILLTPLQTTWVACKARWLLRKSLGSIDRSQ